MFNNTFLMTQAMKTQAKLSIYKRMKDRSPEIAYIWDIEYAKEKLMEHCRIINEFPDIPEMNTVYFILADIGPTFPKLYRPKIIYQTDQKTEMISKFVDLDKERVRHGIYPLVYQKFGLQWKPVLVVEKIKDIPMSVELPPSPKTCIPEEDDGFPTQFYTMPSPVKAQEKKFLIDKLLKFKSPMRG